MHWTLQGPLRVIMLIGRPKVFWQCNSKAAEEILRLRMQQAKQVLDLEDFVNW